MEFKVDNNGIEVKAYYSDREVDEIFIPLLEKLKDIQAQKKRRIICIFAAPPGSGKTTLLYFLKYLSENVEGLSPVQVIGMDGFHRYQDYLLSHTTIRNGEVIPMVKIKGAPETFDSDRLLEAIVRISEGDTCGWPEYNRMTHNPKEDAVTVDGDIVLLEGNYLLLDEDGFRDIKNMADISVKISADENFLRERLIDRKIKSGTSREDAVAFVEYSDLVNVRTCLEKSMDGDVELFVDENGYRQI